jgi:nucleotide-binding universal stress UspA family protein
MKILLPVDGSEGALAAVRHALGLVDAGLRATFVIGNVQEPASLYEVVVAHSAKVIEEVSAAAAAHSIGPAQALLRAAGVEFEVEVGSGDPGHVLVDIAERYQCDMIVLGARGVGALGGGAHTLGSVANSVVHGAAAAVTIVKLAGD